MENTMYMDVVDTHHKIFHGKITKVTAPGLMGDLTILPGHSQLISILKLGALHFTTPKGVDHMLFISGGILEVQPRLVTILADTILRSDEEDALAAKEAIERASGDIKKVKKGTWEYAELQREVQILRALIEMSKVKAKMQMKRY